MKTHAYYEDQMPLYAAGQLDDAERTEIRYHLSTCAECRSDLNLWLVVSVEVGVTNRALTQPPDLAEKALEQIQKRSGFAAAWQVTWQMLRVQVLLTQREIWPAAAAVMAVGIFAALVSNHFEAIYFLAPLIAAASLTISFGPEHDAAYELVMATPMSPWKILLARLSIVSAYNLLLALVAGFILLALVPPGLLGVLILGWLGPMAFLSALALLLSLWIGTSNAIAITYVLWIAQFIPYKTILIWAESSALAPVFAAYQQFWHSPLLLGILSAVLVGFALWSASRPVFRMSQEIQ